MKLWLFLLILFVGCKKTPSFEGSKFQAHVVRYYPVTHFESASQIPSYEIAPYTFTQLLDFATLKGLYFDYYTNASVDLSTQIIISKETPKLRYHIENNVATASDHETFTMLSTYALFDDISSKVDHILQSINLSMATLIGVTGKIIILDNFKTPNTFEKTFEVKKYYSNNAFFLEPHYFFVTRSSPSLNLPLSVDIKVIAHEFGHLLFYFVTRTSSNPPTAQKFADSFVGRGLNEGWADLWSFLITGSTNPLEGLNLDNEGNIRKRNFSNPGLRFENMLSPYSSFYLLDSYYYIGTLFAKALYDPLFEKSDASLRYKHGAYVLKALHVALASYNPSAFIPQETSIIDVIGNLELFFRAFITALSTTPLPASKVKEVNKSLRHHFFNF
jgi:hypothetical protein